MNPPAASLGEAGRVLSSDSESLVQSAISALQKLLAKLAPPADAGTSTAAKEAAALRTDDSFDGIRRLVQDALCDQCGQDAGMGGGMGMGDGPMPWIRDLFPDTVVYDLGRQTWQRPYTVDDAASGSTVTFGDPVEVETAYVPVGESASQGYQLAERTFTADQRTAMAKSGMAMPDGGFPIETKADLENAIKAMGRANNAAAAKAHIIKRAKALGAMDMLPMDWPGSTAKESAGGSDLTGDLVPLTEKAVRADHTAAIKLISPGWGSSGHYSEAVLKRDGPKVFTKGLHMYLDHPTTAEEATRPERSVRDLAGALESDARWDEHGAAGPGLYADARLRSDVAPLIEDLAPHIGVSIRALGAAKRGTVEGRQGPVIESIAAAKSVDFVTLPGRGGRVLQLMEAARTRRDTPTTTEGGEDMTALEEAQRQLAQSQAETARLREALVLREARDLAAETLSKIEGLAEPTRARLIESTAKTPVITEGALDRDATAARVLEAAKAEIAYLAQVTGSGQVRGMGSAGGGSDAAALQESEKRLEAAFGAIGLGESTAKLAAAGRGR